MASASASAGPLAAPVRHRPSVTPAVIAAVDARHRQDDFWWPGELGVDPFLKEQSDRWNGMLADATLCVRVPQSVLGDILRDGRVKNQFETGTSSAYIGEGVRAQAELDLFGYPLDTPASDRPVYAYVEGTCPRTEAPVSQYGNVKLRASRAVRARTTVLAYDSLGGHSAWDQQPHGCPEAIDDATHRSLVRPIPAGAATLQAAAQAHPRPFTFGYVEGQIHGGLRVSEIEEAQFLNSAIDPDLVVALRAAGVLCIGPDGSELSA